MTYLVLQMQRIPSDLLESFQNGHFVAKLTNGTFNSVWIDYVLEVTENKALKSSGGIIGLTHQDTALARWFLSRPLTAEYSLSFSEKSAQSGTCRSHHTDTAFHRKAFNIDSDKLSELFTSDSFIDPFSVTSPPEKLVNFATGIRAAADVQCSLLKWHDTGEDLFLKFAQERFVIDDSTERPQKGFYEPVQKSKIKTMSKSVAVAPSQ